MHSKIFILFTLFEHNHGTWNGMVPQSFTQSIGQPSFDYAFPNEV